MMSKTLSIIADVLEEYEMRGKAFTEDEHDDMLQCYLDALKVEGRSEKTIERYRYIITKVMKSVGVPTRRVTVYHLRSYLSELKERGISDRTANGERQILSAYFNWLQRESLIERNPTANLGVIKCAKKVKKTFTGIDMEKMKMNCKCARDRAILYFLFATGCRISEAMELNKGDIDFSALECVVHGKGNKERTVYIDTVTAMLLKSYIAGRKDDNPALFVGKGGRRLQPGGVRCMMKDLADRSGVEHVHPHKFRRTMATELCRHGMPIQEIASILGHERIDTTMQYVILNDDDIKHSYKRFA
jgi:site-specific recombinase XerD